MKSAAFGYVMAFVLGMLASLLSISPASALCSSYTYNLTNGTTADATQVMANFNCAALTINPQFGGYVYVGNWAIGSTSGLGGERTFTDYTCTPRCEGRINGAIGVALSFGTNNNADTMWLSTTGNLTVNGSGTTCVIGSGTGATNCTSDIRLKRSIRALDAETVLDHLAMIKAVTFKWADPKKDQKENVGVIAQDVLKAFPQLVIKTPTTFKGVEGQYYAVDYAGLTAPLVTAVNTLNGRTKQLEEQVQKLKADNFNEEVQVAQLRTRLEQLERKISVRTASR